MPAGFHPHTYLHSGGREIAVELLCFLAVLQSSLSAFTSFCIHKRNLLKARMVIAPYNQHIGSFSPEPFGWFAPPSLLGARELTLSWNQLHSEPPVPGIVSVMGILRQSCCQLYRSLRTRNSLT